MSNEGSNEHPRYCHPRTPAETPAEAFRQAAVMARRSGYADLALEYDHIADGLDAEELAAVRRGLAGDTELGT